MHRCRWLLPPVLPALLLPVLLLAALVLSGGPAYADDPPAAPAPTAPAAPAAPAPATVQTFGIQPATEAGPDTRGTFTYGVTPGAMIKDHVAVWNYSEQPLTLRLYPADAFNTESGGYDVLPEGTASTRAGSWLRTLTNTLTLPARSRQVVPFTLAVPATAGPGDHPAGIVASLRSETKDAKGNTVAVDQRVGARVNVRVSGDLKAELSVQDVKAVHHSSANPLDAGRTTVSYTVRNTGNVRLGGKQAVRVTNVFGTVATGNAPADLQELLPGNEVRHQVDVSGAYPTFWGTAGITVDPLPVAGDKDPVLSSSVVKRRFASVPWALLVVLLPIAVFAGRWWWNARRRRRDAGSPPPGTPAVVEPGTPDAPTGTGAEPAAAAAAAPAAAPAPVASATAGATAGPGAAALALLGLLAGLLLLQLPAAPSAAAAEPAGTLAFDYAAGRDDDALDLLSSGTCPDPAADYLTLRIAGEGFPAEGAPLTGTVPATVYRTAANGGYVLPVSNTLRVVATRSGSGKLNGAYTITATCRRKIDPTPLREFTGVLTFTSPSTWQATTVAPEGMIHAATAAEPTAAPTAPAAPATRPAAAPEPAPQQSGMPWYSVAALTAGVLVLGRLALPYLRRLGARRAGPGGAE